MVRVSLIFIIHYILLHNIIIIYTCINPVYEQFKLLYNDEDTDGEDNVVKEYEWSDKHRCMIQGTDELISNFSLTQDTLKKLYTNFTNEVSKDDADKQLIDYVFAIGQYFLTCLALNSIGCQTLQNVDMKSENSDWTSRM